MSDHSTTPTVEDHRDSKVTHIFVNGTRFDVQNHVLTGHEILQLAGLPESNHLFLEVSGPGDDRQIGPDKKIELHNGMRFYDVPVGNLG